MKKLSFTLALLLFLFFNVSSQLVLESLAMPIQKKHPNKKVQVKKGETIEGFKIQGKWKGEISSGKVKAGEIALIGTYKVPGIGSGAIISKGGYTYLLEKEAIITRFTRVTGGHASGRGVGIAFEVLGGAITTKTKARIYYKSPVTSSEISGDILLKIGTRQFLFKNSTWKNQGKIGTVSTKGKKI